MTSQPPCSDLSWEGFHVNLPWKKKAAASGGSFSGTFSWKNKNSSSPLKVREAGGARGPLGLTVSFSVFSKPKEKCIQRWKIRQIPIENFKGISRVYKGAVRKAKAQLKLKLARDVKYYKKIFCRYVNNKQEQKENRPTVKQEKRTGHQPC